MSHQPSAGRLRHLLRSLRGRVAAMVPALCLLLPRLQADQGEPAAPLPAVETLSLAEVWPDFTRQDWGSLQVDRSVWGRPLQIGDRKFDRGLGTHACSELVFLLERPCERFEAWVGIDAAMSDRQPASAVFMVLGDGVELFNSGVMKATSPARRVSVSLRGVSELKLVVTDAGDGRDSDHADWAEPVLIREAAAPEPLKPARFHVQSASVRIGINEDGEICSISMGGAMQALRGGSTALAGTRARGPAAVREQDGGVMVSRTLDHVRGHSCTLTERFVPEADSIRWEIGIAGAGEPWSTAVVTRLAFERANDLRFWAPWSDPERRRGPWRDPLCLTPFENRSWHYGNVAHVSPVEGDYIAVPLVTLAASGREQGFSLVLSPEDVLLNMTLAVSPDGVLRLVRTRHRLGGGRPARFTMHLVGHEAGWRGGLRWMADRYPAYFDPPNPRADSLAGCGAYSGDERPIDAGKFRKMAFRINWKLSDDFPYMGMFIPPVSSADDRWTRSCDEPAPPGKASDISCRQMNEYARRMREQGFHVLSYFNVTEFGKNMQDAEIPASRAADAALWKDPVAFLKLRCPEGYLRPPVPTCYGAWVTDVGDPAYRDFLLDQARRHIELLPDTDGICIDRMDWLRYYNAHADDGVSWLDGRPARSLFRSWLGFMSELGPLMHAADKVVFGNTMTMRLELNRHLDGIYSEHGDHPGALNAAALMGIRKPVLAWTQSETLRQPDPDSFFQRHLYLGVYPTAPYPFNHHCITPEAEADRFYLAYGPLLDEMRGKKWVLSAGCVEAQSPEVKVNLFQVPGGYALPVVLGGQATSAMVRVRNIPRLGEVRPDALHPGVEAPAAVSCVHREGVLELQVPLVRGCAMVRLR